MQLSIKTTLAGLFTSVALIAGAQGALSIFELGTVRNSVVEVSTNWLPSVVAINEMRAQVDQVRLKQYRLVSAAQDPRFLAEHLRQYESSLEHLAQARTRYEPLIASEDERAIYNEFSSGWNKYKLASDNIKNLIIVGKNDEALVDLIGHEHLALYDAVSAALDRDVKLNNHGAQQDANESVVAARKATITAWIAIILSLAASFGATLYGMRRISAPLGRITRMMGTLATGDTTMDVPFKARQDEIGAMAAAVQVFKDNLIRTRRLEEETALARASAEEQRRAGMRQMADAFEQAVGGIVGMVSASATELQATAQTMTATATQTAAQSTAVAAAAEEASSNVGTVAAAAEELGNSVQEIGRQVDGSARLAQAAVAEAGQTAHQVHALTEATTRIGGVVGLISSIAAQTNLLALNATIEAARAGVAGRGFAVVAAEVKELAGQTAKATEEITTQIAAIQASTGQAAGAISHITARIEEIASVATSIAAAVEEQGAATREIVRNVSQAAAGTGEVTGNITGVAGAAEETGAAASQVLTSASELSRQSERLSAEVTRFLATVRAA
ncbi:MULTISPECIES: methyl-accepting chemotaxis protein [Methylobacterium]|uniref:methyl-accepting chemotaxis protein n=1 Tax=Methylobacterium TaxID=407 RepID=UPI0013ED1E2F|nr:methyl-accepting chemotaxis protein [Methylobacterium sp. DB0501]NGM34921.1 HAMP domain-containing protein [Methylobacterium sp. DB0501]